MKRTKAKVLLYTTNSREYKITRFSKIASNEGLCDYCPPNKGCNSWRGGRKPNRSWKEYRKTQWKPQTQDSCNELWSERTDCGCNHMSHENNEEGVSTPQETSEVRKAA
ncbi:MAG: hypothetical protein P8J32_02430 [bacterium]|nr:hypothetical protein [bacterium]